MKNKLTFLLWILIIGSSNFFLVSLSLQNQINQSFFRKPFRFELQQNYSELTSLLSHPEPMARATFVGDIIEITLRGFRKFKSTEIDVVLKEPLHVTERLGLYSLNYITKLITEPDMCFSFSELKNIEELLTNTLQHLEILTFIPDRMKFNDHVVSARLESLILLKAFFNDQNHLNPKLEERIDKHISLCVLDLLDDKKFTWRTNHGLMQIRALLAFDFAIKENPLSQKVRNAIEERLEDHVLLDFHIATDGSVFEAASGYWRYVYSQWKAILNYPNLQSDSVLNNRLLDVEKFLHTVTSHDGFIQGFGDSYNFFQDDFIRHDSFPLNYNYRFANGISGINLSNVPHPLHISFTALDNPPHVKKHPEDLSLYLYYGQPFFVNPGTYAWDKSRERRMVLDQKSQNTLFNPNYSTADSSSISSLEQIGDSLIIFTGEKWYQGKLLKRIVKFDNKLGIISIIDIGADAITSFNIHPNVAVKKLNDTVCLLKGEKANVLFSASVPINIENTFISDSYKSLTQVQQFQLTNIADTIITTINLENYKSSEVFIQTIRNSEKTRKRAESAKILGDKFWQAAFFSNPSPKRLIFPRFGFLFLFSLLVFTLRKHPILNSSILIMYLIFCLTDVVLSGALLSLTFL